MNKIIVSLIGFCFCILFLSSISASLNVSLSDQGVNAKNKTSGSVLTSADLQITIYDALTGGNLIYNETFVGGIVNGSWNLMLGANSSNPLPLEFGKIYYKDYAIDGSDLDFADFEGNTVERQFFYSPLGDVSGEDISGNANLTIANITADNGFFTYLGSLANKITHIFATNIDVAGDVNASGTINAGAFVGGGSGVTNVIASDLGDKGCTADKYLQWDGGSWVCGNMPSSGSNVYVNLIPEGTIAAFNRSTCPEGWSPANGSGGTPDLRGIFVRGSGTSGVLQDASGNYFTATYGEYQNDSFQGHWHRSAQWWQTSNTGGYNTVSNDWGGTTYDSIIRDPVTDTVHGTPRTATETRPANIALLYCVKDVDSSPETNNLFDISGNLVYVKNTSHDVGIGTAIPNSKLEVNGTFSVKNATAGQGLYQDAVGNVGIGTATPQNKLNVVGDVNVTGNLSLGNGQIMFNDTSKSYMYYNSTSWVEFGTGSGGGTPANAIMPFYQASCPNGWILADGTSGTPDLRGIFIRGAGTNSVLSMANGTAFSATYGAYQNDSFQGHWHHLNSVVGGAGSVYAGVADAYNARNRDDAVQYAVSDGVHGTPRTGAETRPASFGLIYCMKTTEDSASSNTIWGESGDDIVPNNSSKNVHLSQNLTVDGNVNVSGSIIMGYERVDNACGATTSCTVDCPSGKYILSGGCNCAGCTYLQASNPSNATRWYCGWSSANTNSIAYGICANVK